MRILLTGASGFIGSKLSQLAAERGIEVAPYDYADEITKIADYQGQADLICHLAAAMTHGQLSATLQRQTLFTTNVVGTQAVIELARARRIPILFASTSAVYRAPREAKPLSESAELAPRNDYGLSKLLAEELLRQSRLPVRILRLFNVYGPGQSAHFLVPQLVAHLRGNQPTQLQSPASYRDFIHLNDVATAFLTAAATPFDGGCEIYNIGSGQAVSVRQLADQLAQILGKSAPTIPDAPQSAQTPADAFVADTQAFTQRFGWRPSMSLSDGIATL